MAKRTNHYPAGADQFSVGRAAGLWRISASAIIPNMKLNLAESSTGRVVLHLFCLLRDGKLALGRDLSGIPSRSQLIASNNFNQFNLNPK